MGDCRMKMCIRKVNFYCQEVKAIHCMAYDEDSSRLAVVRSDFTIEVWNLKSKPFLEQVLPGYKSSSVEAVAWFSGRLFLAGLHGCIVEYSMNPMSKRQNAVVSAGHGIWCLAVNVTNCLLAAGSEDGCVYIYEIGKYRLEFKGSLCRHQGRILCLAWHTSGKYLASGSTDVVKIWDVSLMCEFEEIIVGHKENNAEVIIWCIAFTSNMTLISGDSVGRISFWDANTATLLKSIATHQADILALCLSKDESKVYASGIDPVILILEKSNKNFDAVVKNNVWIKSVQRAIHTHDVRALLLVDDCLVSGGVDTYLTFSKYPPKKVVKFSPFSEASYSSVATDEPYLLLQYQHSLEVWQFMPENDPPTKLLSIKVKSKSRITCSDISSNGKWIAYTTDVKVKLLFVTMENEKSLCETPFKVSKVRSLPKDILAANCLAFVKPTKLAVSFCKRLHVVQCDLSHPVLLMSFDTNSDAHLLKASSCGNFLAVGAHDGSVCIYDMQKQQFHLQLPHCQYPPTALSFDPSSSALLTVYSNRLVVEFSLQTGVCSSWCSHENMAEFVNYSDYSVRGILFSPCDSSLRIFYDQAGIYIVRVAQGEPKGKHRMKCEDHVNLDSLPDLCMNKKYEYLLDVHNLCDGTIVAVEVKPSSIHDSLPAPLLKKRYGI